MSMVTQSNLHITGDSDQGADRRTEPRTDTHQTVKAYQPRARRFIHARTINISNHGMLLEIDTPAPLSIGEPIDVAIAEDHPSLIRRNQMTAATIVRLDDNGQVALRIGPDVHLVASAA